MKKIVVLSLLGVLIVSSLILGAIFLFSQAPVEVISCDYRFDSGVIKYDLSFSPNGKVKVVSDPLIGEGKTFEGKYKIDTKNEKITFNWDEESPLVIPEGTLSFTYGKSDGKKYVMISFITFNEIR